MRFEDLTEFCRTGGNGLGGLAYQRALDRVVPLVPEFVGGHIGGVEQVGSPDVGDELGIAGEDAVGVLVGGMLARQRTDSGVCPGGCA